MARNPADTELVTAQFITITLSLEHSSTGVSEKALYRRVLLLRSS